jgi:putative phosphoesterase
MNACQTEVTDWTALIVSDTHGDVDVLERLLNAVGNVDYLIHLGDHAWDIEHVDFQGETHVVRGNTDRKSDAPLEKIIVLSDQRILLTHGHIEHVKYFLTRLYLKALSEEVDVVLFGHTHTPLIIREQGILFINPGSLSRPRGENQGTYGILKMEEGQLSIKVFEFD